MMKKKIGVVLFKNLHLNSTKKRKKMSKYDVNQIL